VRVLVTGASGMVGKAVQEKASHSSDSTFYFTRSRESDLTNRDQTFALLEKIRPNAIIHLAAKVGGVKGNTDYIAEYYTENIRMNTNILEGAHRTGVEKVVSLLSTCVYPDKVVYPLTEGQIHAGEPHPSNFGYAYAKRMLDVQSRAYRQQYGHNFITAVPNNLFGENDNYHLEDSHVIPAITRKMYEAQQRNTEVVLWGDGAPLREFTYSADIAHALLILLQYYDSPEPINIGNTNEISIKEVAEKIAEKIGFTGEIVWQPAMPSGQHRKPSSNERFQSLFNMKYTDFDEALTNTCKWFTMNYPNVRGVA